MLILSPGMDSNIYRFTGEKKRQFAAGVHFLNLADKFFDEPSS